MKNCNFISLPPAVSCVPELLKRLHLDPAGFTRNVEAAKKIPVLVTEYYISLMKQGDPHDPLLRQVLPAPAELSETRGFSKDPLCEQNQEIPGLLRKYRHRALLLASPYCATRCRFCFRRHFRFNLKSCAIRDYLREAITCISADNTIREIILSGGDPLMLADRELAYLLLQLQDISHIKRLRIHSRLPIVMPSRITPDFIELMGSSRLKLILVTHVNHPREITDHLAGLFRKLLKKGVHLLSQTVLLKGVNDHAEILQELCEKLFDADILPYYLHMLDHVQGTAHFEVNRNRAVAIVKELQGQLPGFLLPRLVREQAGKPGKTPLDLCL